MYAINETANSNELTSRWASEFGTLASCRRRVCVSLGDGDKKTVLGPYRQSETACADRVCYKGYFYDDCADVEILFQGPSLA